MFIRTLIPDEVILAFKRFFSKLLLGFQASNETITIEEYLDEYYKNEVYDSVLTYLSSKCLSAAHSLKLFKPHNSKKLIFSMNIDQDFDEIFDGFKVNWSYHIAKKKASNRGFVRSENSQYFVLSFHSKYKEKVHSLYLPYVIKQSAIIKFNNQERKLFTNNMGNSDRTAWSSVPFTHPSTFDTLAITPVLKEEIKRDLLEFAKQKEFYVGVGRTWKRGYLLYGPPGTGKTSLIAAIANFLHFDIYDLELTSVENNSQLKKLLLSTSSKSVIVIEDVDCSLDLSDRNKKTSKVDGGKKTPIGSQKGNSMSNVSLSGVLNFVDGLWSSCGGERLIIFTTNYKEHLDKALLRPGRMDKHINLSYIDIHAFKMLANNYLHLEDHDIMKDVEKMLPIAKVTPAEVAEIFMGSLNDVEMAMSNVVQEIKKRSE
ncbi:hypothetical protein IFM89_038647 [Coptis chinensis]|uniref:AAA+ ATPase domain-containing protein n=1 Tax=Coptis chinensis TaxID=261450 RepID=A0A835I603_9MAGN|nr:hypothetical protein IFM89_038647 [Coptis chinensis]